MKERKIKFTANTARWFDSRNGNTYHSVNITRTRDGARIACPIDYGYGDSYQQTALEAMAKEKWLPVKYREKSSQHMYERENNYPILWNVTDGLKRDCVANGI